MVATIAALLIIFLPACSKPGSAAAPPLPEPQPAESLNAPSAGVASERESIAAPDEPANASQPAQPQSPVLPENPFELERLYYLSGTSLATRIAIIRSLGDTASAGTAGLLGRLFEKEKRFETKTTILEVAGDLDKDLHRERILALLKAALAPNQPQTVREIALRMLADIEDPRALTLLRSAQSDHDQVIKKVAADVLEEIAH